MPIPQVSVISNEKEFLQAIEQMDRMYRALAALRSRQPSINTEQFILLAECPIEDIRRLQTDVETYLGVIFAGSA